MTFPANDVLAIIPARGGSKRLPGKNLRRLGDKPLIKWSIDAAMAASRISRILVTTDDEEILELASNSGVDHVITRPPELANDTAKTSDALRHALSKLTRMPESICLLQPTSPLRSAWDIESAVLLHHENDQRPIVSVCPVDHPTAWCGILGADGSIADIANKLQVEKRSQDHPPEFRLNGAIYIAQTSHFLATGSFLDSSTLAYVMPRERSVDIDTAIDLAIAEVILQAKPAT